MKDLPRHLAIIMDGNGRWAKKRHLPRVFGHRAGMVSVRQVIEECARLGIKVLTLYAFSTENWSRPSSEVQFLFRLLKGYLRREKARLIRNNIVVRTIGEIDKLPGDIQKMLKELVQETSSNSGLIVNLALNYGGRQEIISAINRYLNSGQKEVLNQETFSRYLDTADLPDPDLIIRTSGEMRLSNFLLWQSAYSELYFTRTLWPDFRRQQLLKALREYPKRQRRFGGI